MGDISHHKNKKVTTATLNDIKITENKIIEAIGEISQDSAAGPNGIPVEFYKIYAKVLAKVLLIIWRHSLDNGNQPDESILTVITLQHKGGPKCFPKN